MFVSYAQNLEDVVLYRALKGVGRGCYIDVGAQHPILHSVTRAFYERGWRGINIEPVGEWFQKLVEDRTEDVNLQLGAWSCATILKFYEVVGTGLSTAVRELAERWREEGYQVVEREVAAKPLDLICSELGVKRVHFLKIDAEGAEEEVLEGLSLTAVRPWIIVVEATYPNSETPTHERWEYLLTRKNYEFAYFDGLNRFYTANEHADLKRVLSIPPNCFDDFVRYNDWASQQALAAVRAERDHLRVQYEENLRAKAQALMAAQQELMEARAVRDRLIVEVTELRAEIRARDELLSLKDREIHELHHSESYRFGLFCTWPARKLWGLVRAVPDLRSLVPAILESLSRWAGWAARWALQRPQLRAMAKRIVRNPVLRARIKHALLASSPTSGGPTASGGIVGRDSELPESARVVLEELRRAVEKGTGVARR